jgi:hypothetical protein
LKSSSAVRFENELHPRTTKREKSGRDAHGISRRDNHGALLPGLHTHHSRWEEGFRVTTNPMPPDNRMTRNSGSMVIRKIRCKNFSKVYQLTLKTELNG